MHQEKYYQPDSCIPGNIYYIKENKPDALKEYISVRFVDYCPHPAEVLVRYGSKTKVIHRIHLYQMNGRE